MLYINSADVNRFDDIMVLLSGIVHLVFKRANDQVPLPGESGAVTFETPPRAIQELVNRSPDEVVLVRPDGEIFDLGRL